MRENLSGSFGRAHGHWSGVEVSPEDLSLLYSADVIITLSNDSPLDDDGHHDVYAANNGTGAFAIKFASDGTVAVRDGEIQARLMSVNPDLLTYLAHGGMVRNPRSFNFYPDLAAITPRVDAIMLTAVKAGHVPFLFPPDIPQVRALGFQLAEAMQSLKETGNATPELYQEESAIVAALIKPRWQETVRLFFLEALAHAPRPLGFEARELEIIRQSVANAPMPPHAP